jgi:branched-chain amino acid transport system ATP-binding protein
MAVTNAFLRVENITVRFGGIVALDNFSLDVRQGSIQAVIGPNGAGKSTMLNVITGLYAVDGGTVLFEHERIDGRSPHTITRLGIARTFQNTELFGEMSAVENVMVGLDRHHSYNLAIGMAHGPGYRRSEIAARREARGLLALVGLADDAAIAAAALPFGKQRRLEIARALATRPKLLLLDEPAAGLRAAEVESLNLILLNLRAEQELTILVIDHVMALVMAISDRISVLNFGRKIAEGDPDAVRRAPEVIRAYLGEKAAHALGA